MDPFRDRENFTEQEILPNASVKKCTILEVSLYLVTCNTTAGVDTIIFLQILCLQKYKITFMSGIFKEKKA